MKRVELNERELDKATLLKGDLIFARRSLTAEGAGKCSIILSEDEPLTFESSIIRARLNQKLANPEYFYYLFNSPFGKWLLGTILRQVAVAGITGSDLAKLEVPVPPIDIQNQIASTSCLIDDFIEVNSQTNQTLETIAQTLFKSWFVDFDPVKAKLSVLAAGGSAEEAERAAMCAISARDKASLNTLKTEQPEAYAELARTAALFPSAMQDSELGEIPEGWGIGVIGDLFELHRGFDLPKKERREGHYPVFAAGGYHGQHSEYKIKPPGIITGRSGVIGNVYLTLENYWPLNTTLYIRNFKYCGPYYAYFFLKSCDLKSINSGSAVPSLNRNFVHSMPCIIASKNLLDKFEDLINVHFSKIQLNDSEIRHLSELRDTLLPQGARIGCTDIH